MRPSTPGPAGELHAFGEERAIAAFARLAGAHADRAVRLAMAEAQRGELLLLRPFLEHLGMELGRALGAQRVVEVGEIGVMAELGLHPFERVEEFVTVERDVDVRGLLGEPAQRTRHDAALVEARDAGAPELLEALALEPQQVGLDIALRRSPVGAHHLRFPGPQRSGHVDHAAKIRIVHGREEYSAGALVGRPGATRRGAHRRRHLDRFGHPRLPRPAGRCGRAIPWRRRCPTSAITSPIPRCAGPRGRTASRARRGARGRMPVTWRWFNSKKETSCTRSSRRTSTSSTRSRATRPSS